MSETLFPGADDVGEVREERRRGSASPRLVRPERKQVLLQAADIDSLLDPDHRVRAVWEFVDELDVSAL